MGKTEVIVGTKGEKRKLMSLGYKDNFYEKMFLKIYV